MDNLPITKDELKKAFIQLDANGLAQFYTQHGIDPNADDDETDILFSKITDELENELPDAEFKKIAVKMLKSTGLSDLEIDMMQSLQIEWSSLTKEEKLVESQNVLLWFEDDFNSEGKYGGNADKALIKELKKYASMYEKGEAEHKKELKQAIIDLDSEKLQELYEGLIIDTPTYKESIYRGMPLFSEALAELTSELPSEQYEAIVHKMSWMKAWKRMKFGLPAERKLFEIIKSVINKWDPEDLLSHAPDDEYDMEVGLIADLYSSAKNIDELAWGIYDVFFKAFGYKKYRKSVYPEYTIVAGKIISAVKKSGDNTFHQPDEIPYTLKELTDLEKEFGEVIEKINLMFMRASDSFNTEEMNEFFDTIYERLKRKYEDLNNADLDSLFRYCAEKAKRKVWDDGFYRESETLNNNLEELCNYETKRCRLYFEFPESLWSIHDAWDNLSDENKLKFGDAINVEIAFGQHALYELIELRKKQNATN